MTGKLKGISTALDFPASIWKAKMEIAVDIEPNRGGDDGFSVLSRARAVHWFWE